MGARPLFQPQPLPPSPEREPGRATPLTLVRSSVSAVAEPERLGLLERLVLVAACLLGTFVRVAGVGGVALQGDEDLAVPYVERGYGAVLTSFDGRKLHAGFAFLQRVSCDLFGETVLAYRLPAIVAGLFGLWLLYPLGRRFVGARPAFVATLVLALQPLHVYYSRFARGYSLVFLLVLLLVAALERAHAGGKRRAWIAAALVAGVLPWVQLSAGGAVALVAVASVLWGARNGSWRAPCLAFGGAALLCLALYAPALDGFRAYLERLSASGARRGPELGALAESFGGTRLGGPLLLAASLLASGAILATRWNARVLLAAAVLGGPLALALLRPSGGESAYSRYLLGSLAPMLLVSAWGLFALLRRFAPRAERVGPALGVVFLAYQSFAGPSDLVARHGAFSNSVASALLPRPVYDAPWAGMPALYRQLRAAPGPLVVVEFPYVDEAALLLRDYQRQHGKTVWVGLDKGRGGLFARAPYCPLFDAQRLHEADWLVIHLDLASEVRAYLAFAGVTEARVRADDLHELTPVMLEQFGEPDYRDERVWAWELGHEPGP